MSTELSVESLFEQMVQGLEMTPEQHTRIFQAIQQGLLAEPQTDGQLETDIRLVQWMDQDSDSGSDSEPRFVRKLR
ncbi:hypothetical protein LRY65_05670 [Candidatus Woesebacteria bacterium]|nr:hypothetical protein [Candidatus Woesebacteria bacterium]MCD8506748.1 hypothetical protein [Candidatus Woesebacteria bacterium]MCD8527656.1 hypothetical protein [Candidatus Woesebacteria bacterium]MCD8546374.1 hypothetical protein [Candidatus Woesebacteria bacterium]